MKDVVDMYKDLFELVKMIDQSKASYWSTNFIMDRGVWDVSITLKEVVLVDE